MRLVSAPESWLSLGPPFHDFVYAFSRLRSFFIHDPRARGGAFRRRQYLSQSWKGNRAALANALHAANRAYGAHESALDNIERLRDSRSVVVVAGQQAGILGGPGYTFLKALSVLDMARRMEQMLHTPVIPVFWAATEDHDFAEISSINIVDRDHRLRRLSVRSPRRGNSPASHIPIPGSARTLLGELQQAGAQGGQAELLLYQARACLDRSATMGEWFCRLMSELFSEHGLVVLDPTLPPLRALAAPVMQQCLVRGETMHAELRAAADRLTALGYVPGLALDPEHAHLFTIRGDARLALLRRGQELEDRGGTVRLTVRQVTSRIQKHPEEFSPNVVLRPMVQDTLLPTLVHIAGPGEISYLAQMREIYPLFGLEMPVIMPRLSLTLVEPVADRGLERMGLSMEAVTQNLDHMREERLRELDTLGIPGLFGTAREEITRRYQGLMGALSEPLPTLQKIGEENLERIMAQVDYFEEKALQHHRRRNRDTVRAFRAVANRLRPRGQAQERVLNYLPFLMEHGPWLLGDLLRAVGEARDLHGHFWVYWEE